MNKVTPLRPSEPSDNATNVLRQPPHNYEAERALLGAILMNNRAYEQVAEFLHPDHFADPANGRVYQTCAMLIGQGKQANPVTLKSLLERDELVMAAGGPKYMASVAASAVTLINAANYGRLIHDLWERREMIALGESLVNRAYDASPDESASDVREEHEAAMNALASERQSGSNTLKTIGHAMTEVVEMWAAQSRDGEVGLSYGLPILDWRAGLMQPGQMITIGARPSMGKAQPLTAKVLMRDGSWKRFGDLRLGDDLASVDGAPSKVAGIFPQGPKQIFRITLSDGRSTRACDEHLWSIRTSRLPGERVVSTARLRQMLSTERYRRRIALPLVSGHFGQDYNLSVAPWLLGVLIGNGCMTSGHLSVSTADAATLYRVQVAVGHDCVTATGSSGYDYRLSRGPDLGLQRALSDYGLIGKRSQEKFIPKQYLMASRESRVELLRGLLDTDGWVEKFGAVRYATTSEQLARDVQTLVWSLGGVCTISTKQPTFSYKGEKKSGLPAFTCNISHQDRASLLTLKRKQRRCEEPARFHPPTITGIKSEGIEEAACIQVTHPSALYVTDDYIVTHNTSLVRTIAYHVARQYLDEARATGGYPKHVLFFSGEMPWQQQAGAILTAETNIPPPRRRGALQQWDVERLMVTSQDHGELPLLIDDTPGPTLSHLRQMARRVQRMKGGLGLIILDYLQLMGLERGVRADNPVATMTYLTKGFKQLCRTLDVPGIALSQLNRQVEQRENKRPQMSDLRESGSIEQDSDVIMFLYRDEYYLDREAPQQRDKEGLEQFNKRCADYQQRLEQSRGKAEAIVAKVRLGAIGTAHLNFDGPRMWFSDPRPKRDDGGGPPPGHPAGDQIPMEGFGV